MIFSIAIIVIFVAVSIYFYFRAESLYRQLLLVKKEAHIAKKESKLMLDSFAIVAKKNEEFAQGRLKRIQEQLKDEQNIELLTPLLNNYAMIFRESTRGKGQMHKVVQKSCESYQAGHYKLLTKYIAEQEPHVKRFWGSNNLNGFISFVEATLISFEGKLSPASNKK